MKQRILAIDGNYFAMRCLSQLNMDARENHLETEAEQQAFLTAMNVSLINLYEAFKPYVTNLIFVTDNKSWRKSILPYRPYYIAENSLQVIGYKEQRKAVKEKSSINYDNFYVVFNKFVNSIKTSVLTFDIEGLEGDDILMLLSSKLGNNPDVDIIVFCTDGDLMQIVKDNVILMRNIRSKAVPHGEFVLTNKKYNEIFSVDARAQLLGNTLDLSYWKRLFSMSLFDKRNIDRKLNEGINICTPFRIALIKSICGDKKDNIFSILGWKSATGNLNYSITENHITKALRKHGLELTEKTCQQILTDKDLLINLLIELKTETKQYDADLNKMGQHLKHNLRINVLNPKNIPEEYIKMFDSYYSKLEDSILTQQFDDSVLKKLNTNIKDSAVNLLENSIPELSEIEILDKETTKANLRDIRNYL
jgi:hypothetical protein